MYMHLLGTIVMSHNTYFTTLQRNKPGDQAMRPPAYWRGPV